MEYNKEYEAMKLGELVAKEMQGLLSEQEGVELSKMLAESPLYHDAYAALHREERQRLLKRIGEYDPAPALTAVLDSDSQPNTKKSGTTVWYAVASALLLLSIATLTYLNLKDSRKIQALASPYGEDVSPGRNLAYITLADGKDIPLDSEQSSVAHRDGALVYVKDGQVLDIPETEVATITTPVGGTYQIILPDGTKAWLNAASSLKYPTRFLDRERAVEITGEVYLEVADDAHRPFIVQLQGQRIEVLGTAFNVRSYANSIITTLVHGQIALTNTYTKGQLTLHAGEQATASGAGTRVHTVDPRDFVGWKDGFSRFRDAELQQVCKELERWYDVRFAFETGFKNKERAAISLDRQAMLSTILALLETTYGVRFSIRGKEVWVRGNGM